ncbi:hypothetical protein G6F40_015647 [Rhizopus arrhizus]|nr:hypothetical protein G6F40_015647 [Rhizopus arrhizus]
MVGALQRPVAVQADTDTIGLRGDRPGLAGKQRHGVGIAPIGARPQHDVQHDLDVLHGQVRSRQSRRADDGALPGRQDADVVSGGKRIGADAR